MPNYYNPYPSYNINTGYNTPIQPSYTVPPQQPSMQLPMQGYSYGAEQSQPMNSVIWVQGEAGANAYPVARGQTVMLMDSNPNSNMFYLKSADPYSGRPLPLERYHYQKVVEVNQNDQQSSYGVESQTTSANYVPREEFDSLKSQLDQLQKTLDELTK